ncbi:hypothetical protein HDU96_004686 [Phlyctochytrium bullatum]|nr:hypothetical protein HDU96_004686 [Phlyctochytrium bullatum]
MNRNEETGPSMVPRLEPATGLLRLSPPYGTEIHWTLPHLRHEFRTVLRKAIELWDPQSHPRRFLYAWIGTVFVTHAPRPLGGKRSPGFLRALRGDFGVDNGQGFDGPPEPSLPHSNSTSSIRLAPAVKEHRGDRLETESCVSDGPSTTATSSDVDRPGGSHAGTKTPVIAVEELFEWVVDVCCRSPKCGRGFRIVPPGQCMRFAIAKFNSILMLLRETKKDEVDNLVLRGLAVAGHLGQDLILPIYLRFGESDKRVPHAPLPQELKDLEIISATRFTRYPPDYIDTPPDRAPHDRIYKPNYPDMPPSAPRPHDYFYPPFPPYTRPSEHPTPGPFATHPSAKRQRSNTPPALPHVWDYHSGPVGPAAHPLPVPKKQKVSEHSPPTAASRPRQWHPNTGRYDTYDYEHDHPVKPRKDYGDEHAAEKTLSRNNDPPLPASSYEKPPFPTSSYEKDHPHTHRPPSYWGSWYPTHWTDPNHDRRPFPLPEYPRYAGKTAAAAAESWGGSIAEPYPRGSPSSYGDTTHDARLAASPRSRTPSQRRGSAWEFWGAYPPPRHSYEYPPYAYASGGMATGEPAYAYRRAEASPPASARFHGGGMYDPRETEFGRVCYEGETKTGWRYAPTQYGWEGASAGARQNGYEERWHGFGFGHFQA